MSDLAWNSLNVCKINGDILTAEDGMLKFPEARGEGNMRQIMLPVGRTPAWNLVV